MILCVISMFIYVCDCIGLHNIVIMKYMYLAMLYPINDLNLNKWFSIQSNVVGHSMKQCSKLTRASSCFINLKEASRFKNSSKSQIKERLHNNISNKHYKPPGDIKAKLSTNLH